MEVIRKYKKIMFMNVAEHEFVNAYMNIFKLKHNGVATVVAIEKVWAENKRPVLHKITIKGSSFVHESHATRIIYYKEKMNVLIDFKTFPSVCFACLCIAEFCKIISTIMAEYE